MMNCYEESYITVSECYNMFVWYWLVHLHSTCNIIMFVIQCTFVKVFQQKVKGITTNCIVFKLAMLYSLAESFKYLGRQIFDYSSKVTAKLGWDVIDLWMHA